ARTGYNLGVMKIWTIGHSTRTLDELLALLAENRIALLADVRRFPTSRRYPHFAREPLAAALTAAETEYLWLPELGGRRSRRPGSPPPAWRLPAFAAYADHMETEEFLETVRRLSQRAAEARTAVMCAEAFPYSCHRRLIADWLTAHGAEVLHILAPGR